MEWACVQFHRFAAGLKVLTVFSTAATFLPVMAEAAEGEIEEVLVTATRRESSVQMTPMAVSALTEQQIRDSAIADIRDVDLITPGLWIGGNAGFGQQGVQIRGVGSVLTGIGGDEGVGTYVDGIYQGRANSVIFRFADIDRIEVLRGPQGTLYGRNATGGAIRIITKTPGNELTGSLELTATDDDGLGASGYVMAPLIKDTLSVKFAAAAFERDGYSFSPILNRHYNGEDTRYFSTALNWTPTEVTDVILRAYTGQTETPVVYKAIFDGLPLDTIPIDFHTADTRDFDSFSATISHRFPTVTATAIIGYLETGLDTQFDADGGPVDNVRLLDMQTSDQFSAEFQLASGGGSRFNWIAGVYYLTEEASVRTPFNILRFFNPTGLYFAGDADTTALSVFADLIYDISDRARLTVGARYNDEEKDWRGCIAFFTLLETDFSPDLCDGAFTPDSLEFDSTTPHFVLDYALTDDAMLYASATKGFRSGGWNWTEPTIPGLTGFGPEQVWSYEVGAKMEFWDRRARLNLAAYVADYSDMQVRVTDNFSGLIIVQNAAEATINGFEAEFSTSPTDRFDLTATLAWLDATYDQFAYVDNEGVPRDFSGNRLNRAPEWQTSLMAQYAFSVGDLGTITPRFEWQYTSEIFHDPFNALPAGSEAFHIINLRAQYRPLEGRWGLMAFVDNVGDERYYEHTFNPILPQDFPALISKPRMWGFKVFYDF
jgi:iron complex outermembrane receptor protein